MQIHVEDDLTDDIEGSGVVELSQAELVDRSASFVGIERVTVAAVVAVAPSGSRITSFGHGVHLPGCGASDLSGLRGDGGFAAELGQGAEITLD